MFREPHSKCCSMCWIFNAFLSTQGHVNQGSRGGGRNEYERVFKAQLFLCCLLSSVFLLLLLFVLESKIFVAVSFIGVFFLFFLYDLESQQEIFPYYQ